MESLGGIFVLATYFSVPVSVALQEVMSVPGDSSLASLSRRHLGVMWPRGRVVPLLVTCVG